MFSTLVGVQVTNAQTTTATSSRWTKFYQNKQKQLNEQKARLASSTARFQEQIKNKEAKLASSTAKLQEKIVEREAKITSSTALRQEKLAEKFKTGVSNQIAQVVDNLTGVLDNLKDIDTRITTRIAKLKSENVDTAKAESLLPDAQAKLTTATSEINSLQTSVQSVLASGVSTTTKAAVKAKITEVRNSVKAAHAAYVQVIENLKSGQNKVENSTSTATSTN